MPLSTIIILGVVVAMFVAFIAVIGGVSTWITIGDARERAAALRRNSSKSPTV